MFPILFKIGPLAVRSWGVMLLIGFVLGYWLAVRRGKKYGISSDVLLDLVLYLLLAGVVGGRLLYVLLNLSYYIRYPLEIFAIWNGGLSYFGSLGAGVAVAILFGRKRGIPFFRLADLLAPSLALGYAFGRIGCFLNGCCYGAPTHLPWGVRFPNSPYPYEPLHPVQLYAFAGNILFMFLLLKVDAKKKFEGQTFVLYVLLYCIYRFLAEILRKGYTAFVLVDGLTQAQVACIVFFLLGIYLWKRLEKRASD